MKALENSPAGRRRSSGGSSLRPVIPLSLDETDGGSALDDDEAEEIPVGPVPKSPGSFASAGGVDEVEAVFG